MSNNKLVTTNNDLSITSLGQIFSKSGYFQDARDAAQAVVKILAGQEIGLPPIASMTGINIIKGKVTLSAVAMATVLKKNGKYDYRVLDNSETKCEIEYFFNGESIGKSKFTFEDAKKAGLTGKDNYKKYPRNMLFARAMSNGIRWFCPDVLGGPVYTLGELDENLNDANEDFIEGEVVQSSDMASQIDEFSEWLQKEEERKTFLLNEVKPFVNKLIEDDKIDISVPPPMVIPQIITKVQEQYPNITEKDLSEMLKGA